jgi:hypothetical protein
VSDTPAYTVTVDMPNLHRGEEIEIPGLGLFKNGSTKDVSKEEAEAFRVFHQTAETTYDADENQQTEWTKGPTLLQANLPEGVTVETYKEPDDKNVQSPQVPTTTTTTAPPTPTTTTPAGGSV